ncbi:fimbrial biogenesis chaperone [Frateuria hangzhouensis]|uniref:fimbrial biogenesis chaperone n=1 Tax=Frateuria hangzhouensis TaxID=2995589 RepID=UPI002260CB67|nr:molecular chaperone [Frateuria sp. STR12]MCX7512609.1 molecular chaperone [Frateuria sp. STR12]
MSPFRILAAALLSLALFAPVANANVQITGTRIVFPAKPGEVTVRLTNNNTKPALVEAWIDRGDPKATPDKVDTPFLITPPLFRMDPHKDQSLRIIFTQEPLPADRESLFWLNVLEVPPKPSGPDAAGKNYLQLAIRSRLKVFYRPENLGDVEKAPAQLSFKPIAGDTGYGLAVHNPTPFYITLAGVKLDMAGKTYTSEPGMVAPYSDLRLAVSDLHQAPATGTSLRFGAINDYGAVAPFTAALGK